MNIVVPLMEMADPGSWRAREVDREGEIEVVRTDRDHDSRLLRRGAEGNWKIDIDFDLE